MRKIVQITANNGALFSLSDDGKVFVASPYPNTTWLEMPDLPQDYDLKKLTETGTKVWADVPNATEFVEDLRGNDKNIITIKNDEPLIGGYDYSKPIDSFCAISFKEALKIGMSPEEYDHNKLRKAICVLTNKLLSVGIKEEMPVFVLKPTDKFSPYAITYWRGLSRNKDAQPIYHEFIEWMRANRNKVKEPD